MTRTQIAVPAKATMTIAASTTWATQPGRRRSAVNAPGPVSPPDRRGTQDGTLRPETEPVDIPAAGFAHRDQGTRVGAGNRRHLVQLRGQDRPREGGGTD